MYIQLNFVLHWLRFEKIEDIKWVDNNGICAGQPRCAICMKIISSTLGHVKCDSLGCCYHIVHIYWLDKWLYELLVFPDTGESCNHQKSIETCLTSHDLARFTDPNSISTCPERRTWYKGGITYMSGELGGDDHILANIWMKLRIQRSYVQDIFYNDSCLSGKYLYHWSRNFREDNFHRTLRGNRSDNTLPGPFDGHEVP